MDNFSYFCNTRIEMGAGNSKKLADYIKMITSGQTLLLVSDPGVVKAGIIKPLQTILEKAGYTVYLFDKLSQNPRDTECLAGAEFFNQVGADVVIAVGGGSAMDTGKAIALLGPNGGTPTDYLEGRKVYTNIAPIVCLPTTAGTGSEVTRSAVITESTTHRKLTLKDAALRPVLAILDPILTMTVPKGVTAATGVDALVHAIEGYTCNVSNPISQALGARAMQKIVSSLPLVFQDGKNEAARFEMMEGSLLAGLCFGSSDVAAVHCLAEGLGGLYDTPHGVANSVFLPYVLKFNAETTKEIHARLARYMSFANDQDDDDYAVEKLVIGIQEFTKNLEIPKLKDLPGVNEDDFDRLAELALQNGSTTSNVRVLTKEDYLNIIYQAYNDSN